MTTLLNKSELNIRDSIMKLKDKELLALVINNQDPFKMGRVQIRISLFHRGVPDDKLPWASPLASNSANGSFGSYMPVTVGSYVLARFMDESGFNITYENIVTSDSLPIFFAGDYGNIYGTIDELGNQIYVNKTEDTINIKHHTGSSIIFERDGSISIDCKDFKINSESLSIKNNFLNIDSGDTKIVANSIEVNSTEYKNSSTQITNSANTIKLQSQTTIDIQSLVSLIINSLTSNINGTTLNLNGGTTNVNSAGVINFNGATFTCNAASAVDLSKGIILPGKAQSQPVTPPIATPAIPKQPVTPQDLSPLPTPEIPNVKDLLDF